MYATGYKPTLQSRTLANHARAADRGRAQAVRRQGLCGDRYAGNRGGCRRHDFADKQALFRAVVELESSQVAAEIETAASSDMPVREALIAGGRAFLGAMREPGRTRLLLLDGPAVLGRAQMDAIDAEIGAMRSLREGLAAAMAARALRPMPLDAVTLLLSSAYDRAALAVEAGAEPGDFMAVLTAFVDGLAAPDRHRGP
jgi:AcrR family transcriptional regulator